MAPTISPSFFVILIKLLNNYSRIKATDADTSEEYNTITYWTDDHTDTVHIDSSTGKVYLIGELDVDLPTSVSELKITVSNTFFF